MRIAFITSLLLWQCYCHAQAQSEPPPKPAVAPEKDALKFNLNEGGSHYFQFTVLNQTWVRFNQSNPGTLVEGTPTDNTFDIGLRRTRFQLFGQVSDRVFIYFQFGQNNFNAQYNTGSNRKIAPFFHDALGEYRVSNGNQFTIGGGLTIANGLSRFSQPSIGTIMTMDVPLFAQATVDQTDQFARKLSIFARGQVGKLDYRLVLSDPFPITSNGAALPALASNASFAQQGHHVQPQAYLAYQFFEHEGNATPYMTGTYLGKKKVFNIAVGGMFQKDAMWKRGDAGDTVYQDMKLFAVESFLDMPLSSKKDAINAYAGFFNTDYGTNYLRYNGAMNPANGTSATNGITGHGPTYGNTYPMFGTGRTIYSQVGYLLPEHFLKMKCRVMPYSSFTASKFDRLNGLRSNTVHAGVNFLVNGHKSKFTLDWQNRPTFEVVSNEVVKGKRLNSVTLQYQVFF